MANEVELQRLHEHKPIGSLRLPRRKLSKQEKIYVACAAISSIIFTACLLGNFAHHVPAPIQPKHT